MNQSKQQLNVNKSYNKVVKVIATTSDKEKTSITYIEHLSNEVFYEIFDYVDVYDVYQSFANLNTRFQDLLIFLFLRFEIKISRISVQDRHIQHRYIDFNSKRRVIPMDSLFHHLESLRLIDIESSDILQRLSVLSLLPRLVSLTLSIEGELKNLNDVYQLIFKKLPTLRNVKVSYNQYNPYITLPIATNNQFSSIEHLNINHSCRLNNLIAMLSYTPRLSHLTCKGLIDWDENIRDVTISLPNLIFVSIRTCLLQFNEFEMFIKKISRQLQVLRVSLYTNKSYFDADRWEQLISQHIPHLRTFHFRHEEIIDNDFNVTRFYELINRFHSSFWIERQWVSNLSITINGIICRKIMFSINPYRKKWNQSSGYAENNLYTQHAVGSTESQADQYFVQTFQSAEVIINCSTSDEYNELILNNLGPVFNMTKITHLNIKNDHFFIGLFIKLLRMLPDLDSLELKSLSLIDSNDLSHADKIIFRLFSNFNKITKVILTSVTELEQVQLLIDLCPRVQSLEVYCSNDIDVKSLVRLILMKNFISIPHLNVLCLSIPTANDMMAEELKQMIDLEKVNHGYTIKRAIDKIYVHWK